MGLMVCQDCGKKHSTEASLCPECARPNPRASANGEVFLRKDTELAGVVLNNKYKLEQLIGKGGMAAVYQGTHLQLAQKVAIKIVYQHLAIDPEIKSRFRKEAQIQFKLQHPGLVRVLDLIDEQGYLGMAMDWIEGSTLWSWMRKRKEPPSQDDILRLFVPLLDTMAYAHKEGVIHRDLKPGNILLHGPSGEEQPKIMDFGIAKTLNDTSHILTRANAALGTPTYMAPEQIQGSREIDHRADIYSLGIILCSMTTGRAPFKGDSPLEVANAHINKPVPSLRSLYHFADSRLDPIVSRALAKDREHRFHTCEEFAEALKAALDEPPIDASLDDAPATVVNLQLPLQQTAVSPGGSNHWFGDELEDEPEPFKEDLFAPDNEDEASLAVIIGLTPEADKHNPDETITTPGLAKSAELNATVVSSHDLPIEPADFAATIQADASGPLKELLQARLAASEYKKAEAILEPQTAPQNAHQPPAEPLELKEPAEELGEETFTEPSDVRVQPPPTQPEPQQSPSRMLWFVLPILFVIGGLAAWWFMPR